jgi:hypothetical protein
MLANDGYFFVFQLSVHVPTSNIALGFSSILETAPTVSFTAAIDFPSPLSHVSPRLVYKMPHIGANSGMSDTPHTKTNSLRELPLIASREFARFLDPPPQVRHAFSSVRVSAKWDPSHPVCVTHFKKIFFCTIFSLLWHNFFLYNFSLRGKNAIFRG